MLKLPMKLKICASALALLVAMPGQAQIASGTSTLPQATAPVATAPTAASPTTPPAASAEAAPPSIPAAPAANNNSEAERVLFSDANSFGTNQAQDLRTRTAAEQIEILTRYVAIQSEQIRALEAKIRALAANNPNSEPAPPQTYNVNMPLVPEVGRAPTPQTPTPNVLPNLPTLNDSQRSPANAPTIIVPTPLPAPQTGGMGIPQNGTPTPKP